MSATRSRVSIIPQSPVTDVDGSLDFDATTRRVRDRRGRAIRHPREVGREGLVDDVALEPVELSLTGHFTDTPLYYAPGFGGYPGRAEALARGLRAVQDAKVLCTVVWGDEVLTSMVIESVSEPRQADADQVDADVRLVQIEVGRLKLIAAVPDATTQALGQVVDVGWLP